MALLLKANAIFGSMLLSQIELATKFKLIMNYRFLQKNICILSAIYDL